MHQTKILIINPHQKEILYFETILGNLVDQGVELLFANTTREGLEMFASENPQLVFLDSELIGPDQALWKQGKIVILRDSNAAPWGGEDDLLRPLKEAQVLQKCREALDLEVDAPPIPPM